MNRISVCLMSVLLIYGCDDRSSSRSTSSSSPAQATPVTQTPAATPAPVTATVIDNTLQPKLQAATDDAKRLKTLLSEMKKAAVARLALSPDYVAAKQKADAAEAAYKKAQDTGQDVVAASQARLDAKSPLKVMELKAIDNDAAVKKAAQQVVTANVAMMAIQNQIDQQKAEQAKVADAEIHNAAVKIMAEHEAKQNLQQMIDTGFVYAYDSDGSVRVDPLTWLGMSRDNKATVIKAIAGNYTALGIPPSFDVKSNRNDTVFASNSVWSGVTVNH